MQLKTLEAAKYTSTLPLSQEESIFNWRQCWYPVIFVQDLPKDLPHSFSLYDEPFVLFRNQEGRLACLTDCCPHRAARLSDGQIIDGRIECLYHGWQFGSDGHCLHIPQLPAEAKIPANACVPSFVTVERQGIVWVWFGEAEAADDERIPTVEDLDKPEFVNTDYIGDLPYDQAYAIENLLDPAHAHISHHGTLGNRELAQPLEMVVLDSSIAGIRGKFRRMGQPNAKWMTIDFVAPNLVIYKFHIEPQNWCVGLAFYAIPLGKGRCRILARNYLNFFTWKTKLTPRWFDHWKRSKILEEDLPLLMGVQEQIERLRQRLKDVYLPLKTCDTFVIEYRKWLDEFGSSLPFYEGYSTAKSDEGKNESDAMLLDRFSRHTAICRSCNRAYQVTNRLKQGLVTAAIALAAFAIVTDGSGMQIAAVSASLFAVALAIVTENVKTKFENSYTRH